MTSYPGPVTPEGDIALNNQGSAVISITVRDDAGVIQDVSSRIYWFETSTGYRLKLTNGGFGEKVLTISQEALSDSINKNHRFVVKDETEANHEVYWEGRLFVRGWV